MVSHQNALDEISRIGGKHLTRPLAGDDMLLEKDGMSYFDKDGFELTRLEQYYHKANKIETSGILNHCSVAIPWATAAGYGGSFKVDHGFLSARLGYGGPALDQIRRMMPKRPELIKLRSLLPKFGVDLSIDFIPSRINDLAVYPFEVLHLEYDYRDVDDLHIFCKKLERAVTPERIEAVAREIVANAEMLRTLPSDDQSDWKAKLFGFERAFVTRPVI